MHAPPEQPPSLSINLRRLDADWLGSRPYQSHFCEENAWWLAADAALAALRRTVVVITNPGRSVAMWQQRAAAKDPVIWDYHVVVVVEALDERGSTAGPMVLDHDCRAGAVLPLDEWLMASFPVEVAPQYAPRFRLVAAADYVARLASDRRHMRNKDGEPVQPFPSWPAIGDGKPNTLDTVLDLGDHGFGDVVDLDGFAEHFGLTRQEQQ